MEPNQKLTSTTTCQTTAVGRALFQFSDFGAGSKNLSVLVNDKGLRNAYLAAEAEGELPTNRARVLILGEPRAGKTSLLNRLLGREFDHLEQPTHGIETRMCHVTNVDKQWNESEGAKADDIRECAAAVTVLKEASAEGFKTDKFKKDFRKSPSTSSESSETPLGADSSLRKILPQFFVVINLMGTLAVLYLLGVFQYGFVVFVWICISMFSLSVDYNNAYRFATTGSFVCVLFEATIRIDQPLEKLACDASETSPSSDLLFQLSKRIFLNLLHTSIVGISSGLGFRTGIAVALAMCVHPWETEGTPVQDMLSWNMLLLFLICIAGGFFILLSYKYCTINNRWHIRRTIFCCALITLTCALFWGSGCWFRTYWFIFLNFCAMVFGTTWGCIFGRRLVLKYGFQASYVIKKVIGLCIGFYFAYMCGWSFRVPECSFVSLAIYIVSVSTHPLFDLHVAYKIWRAKQTFPVKMIREQMKTAVQGQPLLETKLSLWDFAGDTLYHCTHHVFMPDRALYVIVFNLEAAVSNEDVQLQKLLFWLHSVCAHARHPDAVIMIVGTHKDSVPQSKIKRFTDKLHDRITPEFCHRLVLNPVDDKPLFLVENSKPLDEDFKQMRAEIFKRVESAEYAQEKYPIKYLHFYREIQNRRKLAQTSDFAKNVATLREIQELAKETCDVESEEQLKKMLRYFREAGEIIYKEEDEILRNHVVLDPQFLVDVMKKVMFIPRGSHRNHRYAIEWRNYENTGILSQELLLHIYCEMSHLVPLFTNLLEAYDLVCPIAPVVNTNCRPNSLVVPAMLPSFQGNETHFWKSSSTEEVFYFDFGFFDPRIIYHRLLTRCLTHACLDKMKPDSKPLIFADRCRFHIGTSFVFKLQLERRFSHQQLLSVAVVTFEPDSSKLLKFLVGAVRSIVLRDFPELHFTFGPRCFLCSKTGTTRDEHHNVNPDAIHVLKMAGNDEPFPTKFPVVMLCGQQRCEVSLTRQTTERSPSSSLPPRKVTFGPETLITKIPPDIFGKVCGFLNASGQRNWKMLAGELGKDVEFVAALDSQRVPNPSESLLRDWAMKGGVTVADLLEILDRASLERKDIIEEVRAAMQQQDSNI
ncbi:uncharacterized protein LOC117297485 [Asterias rubens]|uniref:uncharacterized protein LOC117297485 n=1 Tax=Asterias rubens TaxID=7604 RepID=UPI0014557520|nr:uncharacterized protein LOC117297485 [Asterias rubens]XP_033636440.1 uncharacterized protein LOC117297485 [Asterias rubens]XP_033636441.1 uncharacterized protein LOC117297485 [Asterias rubens]XP_033636442.1 uncharacterized protein LOC117297485 [Asterias rubens]